MSEPRRLEPNQLTDTAISRRPMAKRQQWHYLYYLLAAFNILTVAFTLRLNYQLQETFARSVEVSHKWDERSKEYAGLAQLAHDIHAPVNNWFETGQTELERARLRTEYDKFKARLRILQREIKISVDPAEGRRLLVDFDRLRLSMEALVTDAERLFGSGLVPATAGASQQMVRINRDFGQITTLLSELRLQVSSIQARQFDQNMDETARLRRLEFVIAGCVLFMLAAAVIYGERITRRMTADSEALDRAQQELVTTARRAGMAEIATGVLHNVGNVLNSVNVSSTLVVASLKKSRIANVDRVARLLKEQEANLGTFMTQDPRGKQLPGFLQTLATHLQEEQAHVLHEMESLSEGLDHVKKIVAMQQNYAKEAGVYEPVSIRELIEDALRLNTISLQRHDIKVRRELADLPVVTVDRHKVMQILVNLLTNAKHALDKEELKDKNLTVRAVAGRPGRVLVSVSDNGVGITPKNMTRIFQHGFTTKEHGHGFGLHHGALAAKEMGGALTVQSDGPGRGATFTLELPCERPTPA